MSSVDPTKCKFRAVWSLGCVLLVALLLGAFNLLASHVIAEREGQKQCAFVIVLDDAYQKLTPEQLKNPVAKQLQFTIHDLRASLGCKPADLRKVGK